ncbi:MAG: YfjI family protein [Porcipelethomonas sp.]
MSLLNLSDVSKDSAGFLVNEQLTSHFFTISMDEKERAENFRVIMDKARELGVSDTVFQHYQEQAPLWKVPELWETPKPFGKEVELAQFPLGCLPEVLERFVRELSANVQVSPDMCVLPLLSVLSLVTQGKAVILNPGGGNTETLNLYTLTIAEPGERKSGVFKALTAPLYSFQREENQRREPLIREYKFKKAALTKQIDSVSKGKNASLEKAHELAIKLDELEPIYPLTLNVTDTTPEALASEMIKNGGKIGILSDEGGIFDILSGLYSSGTANIDLLLKGYDGSPYNVIRCSKQSISLENPLITIGLMAQTEPFERAMRNPQFSGRGFVHRFLFSFPQSKAGHRSFRSEYISQKAKDDYKALIYRLLQLKTNDTAVIKCGKEAYCIMRDYSDKIESDFLDGGIFEYMKEWGNKQVGRALKIAGILHLCEHSPEEPLSGDTALNAVNIAMWSENHALKAFGEICTSEEDKTTEYILKRIKQSGSLEMNKREIMRNCKKIKSVEELEEPLNTLEDMGYIREVTSDYSGAGRKPSARYKINPLIYS